MANVKGSTYGLLLRLDGAANKVITTNTTAATKLVAEHLAYCKTWLRIPMSTAKALNDLAENPTTVKRWFHRIAELDVYLKDASGITDKQWCVKSNVLDQFRRRNWQIRLIRCPRDSAYPKG